MKRAASGLALAAVLLVAGCGGYPSDSGSDSATTVEKKPDAELEQRVEEFNSLLRETKPGWRFSAEKTVQHFVPGDTAYEVVVDEGESTATATSPSLEDDSVRHERYELDLLTSDADGWTIGSAIRTFQCQPNRGHQDFSAELCR
ncbi:MAG: hypothetical protein H0V11_06840 [Actinobacteria bacterium]|nr:hypothetical protein [Actinomycetota bacterium]